MKTKQLKYEIIDASKLIPIKNPHPFRRRPRQKLNEFNAYIDAYGLLRFSIKFATHLKKAFRLDLIPNKLDITLGLRLKYVPETHQVLFSFYSNEEAEVPLAMSLTRK